MNRKRVSVIIPAYNAASCLDQCLSSVFCQDMDTIEVIVVNDGSTDQTAAVAATYGNRIRYVEQTNQGQGAARNVGLRMATAEYIAFLDADDYWLPGFLSTCVDFLDAHPRAVAVSTGQRIKLWGHAPRICPPILNQIPRPTQPMILDDFFRFWADQDHITTGSALIRRSVILEAGPQRADLRISQDLEYWGYIATFGPWGFIPKVLWVSDPTPSAAVQGWRQHYALRHRLCPDVTSWEKRIVPRLTEKDKPGFIRVRGRVAAGYVHAMILGGHDRRALATVRQYGPDMPDNRYTRILKWSAGAGSLIWCCVCEMFRFREQAKSLMISLSKPRPRSRNKQCLGAVDVFDTGPTGNGYEKTGDHSW